MSIEPNKAPGRLLTIAEVAHKVGVSAATIHRWIAAEKFPRQRKLGTQTSRWPESEIDEWIGALPT